MKSAILTPQVSVGHILLGDKIDNYHSRKLEYTDTILDSSISYYSFEDISVTASVEDGKIESIYCERECIWKGTNLIGLKHDEFKLLFQKDPDDIDHLLVYINKEGDIQRQDVFDYDDIGLQIWAYEGVIVTVIASDFREEN